MRTRRNLFFMWPRFEMATGLSIQVDPVAQAFMSDENIEHLHRSIIRGVAEATDGDIRIGRQSQTELTTIMRSVYASEARHLPFKIAEQVAVLNESVLSYSIPQIVIEARSHRFYLRDREQSNREPAPRSVMTSTTGSRSEVVAAQRAYFAPLS